MGATAPPVEDAQGFAAPTAKSLRAAAEGRAHAVHLLLSRAGPRPAWVSAEWPAADFNEEPGGVSVTGLPAGSRQKQVRNGTSPSPFPPSLTPQRKTSVAICQQATLLIVQGCYVRYLHANAVVQ